MNELCAESSTMIVMDEASVRAHGGIAHVFDPRRPALLRRVASQWPLMHKWSESYLVSTMGDYEVKVARDSRPALSRETCTLRTYFEKHRHLSTITFDNAAPDRPLPPFLADVPIPNLCFDRERINAFFFYHANASMGGLPHCHMDAFNILQQGRKHWVLYDADPDIAPRGDALLRRCHAEYGAGHHVRDWFEQQLEPLRAEGIEVYECIQEPGDIVYIPEHFAHAILNLEPCMGVAFIVDRPDKPYARNHGGGFSPHGADVASKKG